MAQHQLIYPIAMDNNHVLAEKFGSIHFYIYCPSPESLAALHSKKDNGVIEEQFRKVLEVYGQERMTKEDIVVDVDLVDGSQLVGMYRHKR